MMNTHFRHLTSPFARACLMGCLLACGLLFSPCATASETLIEVYQKQDSCFLRIDRKALRRDIFLTTRVIEISGHRHIAAGQTFHPGKIVHLVEADNQLLFQEQNYSLLPAAEPDAPETPGKIVRFVEKNDWLLFEERDPTLLALAGETVYDGVRKNQLPSYPFVFPIHSSDAEQVTIDVTRFFAREIPGLLPLAARLTSGTFEPALSGIYHTDNHGNRVNIQSELIYSGGEKPFSVRLNYNILVMDSPMRPRREDPRVGYLTRNYRRLSADKPYESLRYITRWDLQPKDRNRYASGQLTEVVRPIVFYLDPALPPHVAHYARLGLLDWNRAFEAIGLKEVIQVRDIPEDEAFNIHDISVNAIRYIPKDRENAMGATLVDPRSGEILQADIYWYHQAEALLRKWRFVQTAACDPAAHQEELPQELLGEMIRYVTAHEMGHVLGLKHNMRGSFAYPVDSLRSASFTSLYGTTASIMDYARFNYVAQPGDLEKGVKLLPPLLGPYDYMAIEWGYTPVPDGKEERDYLNDIIESRSNDPMYLFAKESKQQITEDPSAQANILGDDLIRSARYGIENLKYMTAHLGEWSAAWSQPRETATERYQLILRQFYLYLYSTSSYIGGAFYLEPSTRGADGGYQYVSQAKGLEALDFVLEQLLHSSDWLVDEQLHRMLGDTEASLTREQDMFLKSVLTTLPQRFALNAKGDISLLLRRITAHLLAPRKSPSLSVQSLRASYLRQLGQLATAPQNNKEAIDLLIATAAKNELERIASHKKYRTYSPLIHE